MNPLEPATRTRTYDDAAKDAAAAAGDDPKKSPNDPCAMGATLQPAK